MPNRGKLVFNEKKDFQEKHVYTVVKRVLNADSIVKKGEKFRVEKALKHLAHRVHALMSEHESDADVGLVLESLAALQLHVQHPNLPQVLGRASARDIFEVLLGPEDVLEPHLDYVHHDEKPGRPAPVNLWTTSPGGSDVGSELSQDSDSEPEQSDDAVDPDARASTCVGGPSQLLPSAIWLLEFARSPKEFKDALLLSPELAACRAALEEKDFSCNLKGGAKVFVRPDQYKDVLKAIKGRQLKPRHVIVSEEFEHSLQEAVKDIGKGVRAKSLSALPPRPMIEKRTFLELPLPSSLWSGRDSSAAITKSTTDANQRTAIHPRQQGSTRIGAPTQMEGATQNSSRGRAL